MRKQIVLFTVLLILSGLAVSSPRILPKAHALTGLVCLQDPSNPSVLTSNPCPTAGPTLDGPAPGTGQLLPTQIRIGVYISGSDALTGFDVSLISNHTILKPAGVDTTGTVVPGSTTVVAECLGGVNVTAGMCAPTDTVDTLHFVLVGGFGSITTAPTTGLLFIGIYNITGTVLSGITVGFQTGCSNTSNSPLCVVIANASNGTTPDTESVQTAGFNNHAAPPWVAISSNSTSLNFVNGSRTGNHLSVTATAKNGWPGASTDSVLFSVKSSQPGIVASFAPASCSTLGASCSVVLTLTGAAGNYTISVQGRYVLTDQNFGGQTDTLVGPVTLQVIVRDFSLTLGPTSLSITVASSATSSIGVSSQNGFVGSVTLEATCTSFVPDGGAAGGGRRYFTMAPLNSCPFVTLSQTSFSLSKGSSGSSMLSIPSQSGPGTFSIFVAAYGSVNHFATLHLVVSDFVANVPSAFLFVDVGSSTSSTVSLTSLVSFAGSISLSATSSPSGLVSSFSPSSVPLTAGSSGSSLLTISAPTGTATGSYAVNVTGTGGGVSHSLVLTVLVHPTGFLYPLVSLLSRQSGSFIVGSGLLGLTFLCVASVAVRRSGSEKQLSRRRARGDRVIISPKELRPVLAFASLGGSVVVVLSATSSS